MGPFIKEVFPVLLAVLIPLAAFTTGLQVPAAGRDGVRLWRRPRQLLRDLLAVLILVPLWTLILVAAVPVSPFVRGGLLIAVLAVGIGPAAGMKRMAKTAPHPTEALDLNLVVLALSMVFVPIGFAFMAAVFQRDFHVGAGAVAKVVLGRALVPLLLGLGIARLSPRLAAAVGPVLAKIVNIVLLLVVVLAVIATWKLLAAVGGLGWLVCVAAAAGAILIGHLLGGHDPDSRAVVAAASTMRFPALALVLAHALPQRQRVVPVVLAYVIVAFLGMTVYGAFMARRRRKHNEEERVVLLHAAPRQA